MYKALDIRDNKEIIILNPKWLEDVGYLREIGRQDFLVCQGCKQSVFVRAGTERREHFAHKHLANCDYIEESANLRNARAILYEWLVSKFGENVSIEKKIDSINLFRYIDCWVVQGSKIFAYWIFDSTLKPEKRDLLKRELGKLQININWVFVNKMLRIEPNHNDRLILSTTEREFIHKSKYDPVYDNGYNVYGSLHYLDSENQELTTFRALYLSHGQQVYKGYVQNSKLEKMKISLENGEFIHEKEDEKLQQYSSLEGKWETIAFSRGFKNHNPNNIEIENKKHINSQQSNYLLEKIGTCVFCGKMTDDWWWHDGKTGECKCKSCLAEGKC